MSLQRCEIDVGVFAQDDAWCQSPVQDACVNTERAVSFRTFSLEK